MLLKENFDMYAVNADPYHFETVHRQCTLNLRNRKMDFNTGTKEAEIYRSMGLLKESLTVYDEVLAELPKDDTQHIEMVNKTIRILKKEIESQETHAPQIPRKIFRLSRRPSMWTDTAASWITPWPSSSWGC